MKKMEKLISYLLLVVLFLAQSPATAEFSEVNSLNTNITLSIRWRNVDKILIYFPVVDYANDIFIGKQKTITSFNLNITKTYNYNFGMIMSEWYYDDIPDGELNITYKFTSYDCIYDGTKDSVVEDEYDWAREIFTNSEFLNVETGTYKIIDTDDPEIINLAKKIVGNETRVYYQVNLLYEWLRKNVKYETKNIKYPQSPQQTLETLSGDCDDITYLFLSLARSLDIPAYSIDGIILSSGLEPNIIRADTISLHTFIGVIMPSETDLFDVIYIDIVNDLFGYKPRNYVVIGFDAGSSDYLTKNYKTVQFVKNSK